MSSLGGTYRSPVPRRSTAFDGVNEIGDAVTRGSWFVQRRGAPSGAVRRPAR